MLVFVPGNLPRRCSEVDFGVWGLPRSGTQRWTWIHDLDRFGPQGCVILYIMCVVYWIGWLEGSLPRFICTRGRVTGRLECKSTSRVRLEEAYCCYIEYIPNLRLVLELSCTVVSMSDTSRCTTPCPKLSNLSNGPIYVCTTSPEYFVVKCSNLD